MSPLEGNIGHSAQLGCFLGFGQNNIIDEEAPWLRTRIRDNAEASSGTPEGSDFQIRKLYVKDVSFESPAAPQIFTRHWEPTIELQLHTDAMRFGDTDYEVTLTGTVTGKADEETAFLAEVQVAGIFTIVGMPEEELTPLLGSYCPTILFSLPTRGGFRSIGAGGISAGGIGSG